MKYIPSLVVLAASLFFLTSCGDGVPKPIVFPKATHLYFADYAGKKVGLMDVNTPGSFTLIADESKGLDTISGIAIDFIGGKIYAAEEMKNQIIRFNVDGTGSVEVLYDESDSVNIPTSIALHVSSNSLYWGNSGTGQIKKGTMDGTAAAESLRFNGVDSVIYYSYGLAVDKKNEWIYFSDLSGFAGIWAGRLDGKSSRFSLFSKYSENGTVLRNPSAIFLDEENAKIYWADEGLKSISVGSIATSTSTFLFNYGSGVNRADGIAVDRGSGKVYWTETDPSNDSYVIARGNLDGTGTREVVLQGVESYSIALKFEGQ
ncbi:MAG TPA: hypothetical protein VIN08_26880 [Ohtaekwangia sp.]|uniref:hypothetical protein n=1 Tax=Ohtaekwangia sp. TaxID=2066019 RepID=UPI002F92501C